MVNYTDVVVTENGKFPSMADIEWRIYLPFFHCGNKDIACLQHNLSDSSNPKIDKYTLK